MLPQSSPCKQSLLNSSPQKFQHVQHWRPSPSKRRGSKHVAGALLADWNEAQVKSSNSPGSKINTSRHAAGTHDDALRAAKPSLSFHEWKQQKQQQAVAATTGGFVAGGVAANVGRAEATAELPQGLPVLEPIVLDPQAASSPASLALPAEDCSCKIQSSGQLQQLPNVVNGSHGAAQEGHLLKQVTDLAHTPEAAAVGGQASQDAVAHQIATNAPMSAPIGLLSAAPNNPIDASSSSSMQGAWSSVSSATSSAAVSATVAVQGGGGGVEQSQGQEGVRRSVLGPLESAVGAAVSDAWLGATERLAAAIDDRLPDLDEVPGGEQLQGMLEGIKQLGSQLSSQMHSAWPTSPTLTKVLATLAASLGLLFLVRAPSLRPSQQQQQQQQKGSKPGPPAMIVPRSKASTASTRTESSGGVQGGVGEGGGGGGKKGSLWDEAGALGGLLAAIVGEWQEGMQSQGRPQGLQPGEGGNSATSSGASKQLASGNSGRASGSSGASDGGASRSSGVPGASSNTSNSSGASGASISTAGGPASSAWAPRSEGVSGSGLVQEKNDRYRLQDQEQARAHLKRLLREANKALGPTASIMPVGQYEPLRREMDTLMQQLEMASGHAASGSNAQSGSSRRESSNSISSSVSNPQGTEWSGSGLGVAQWDTWERKTGPNEWDSRTPTGLKPPPSDPRMLGAWELSYVSLADLQLEEEEGGWLPPATSITALFVQVMNALPGFGVDQVVQHLWEDPSANGSMAMASTATFRLGPLGSLRLCARGGWRESRRHGTQQASRAVAWFETLGVQPLSLLGFAPEEGIFPEVVVPLPSESQQPTEFITTYLDADSRITRASSGAYLFRKLPPASKGALLAPA